MPWKRMATALIAALLISPVIAIAEGPPRDTPWPTRGWETSTPEAQGLDSGRLARLVEQVGLGKQDSLLIVRHGRIVVDAYYAPYAHGIRHDLRSVTKSVTGTLIGIALNNGALDSAEHPVVDLFAGRTIDNLDDRKKAITVQHLLDMASGIAWQERNYTPDEAVMRMYQSKDRAEFVLNQPMATAPGSRFDYNSGDSHLLSAIISKQTGLGVLEYGRRELFAPLGIDDVNWGRADATGIRDGSANLSLAPHDMAKIGYLYLHRGLWDGRRILPAGWTDRAAAGAIAAVNYRYANQWWSIPEKGAYMARGRHSQLILVLPRYDIVAAVTGSLRDDEFFATRRLIDDVVAAVRSDDAVPDDAAAQALLEATIRNAAVERPLAVAAAPPLAAAISGKTYRFARNNLYLDSFALNLSGPEPSWEFTIPATREQPARSFGGPLGLDGTFKKSLPREHGIDAVKARWVDSQTLEVERRILGHSDIQLWRLAFDGSKVVVNFENTDGFRSEVRGEQAADRLAQ